MWYLGVFENENRVYPPKSCLETKWQLATKGMRSHIFRQTHIYFVCNHIFWFTLTQYYIFTVLVAMFKIGHHYWPSNDQEVPQSVNCRTSIRGNTYDSLHICPFQSLQFPTVFWGAEFSRVPIHINSPLEVCHQQFAFAVDPHHSEMLRPNPPAIVPWLSQPDFFPGMMPPDSMYVRMWCVISPPWLGPGYEESDSQAINGISPLNGDLPTRLINHTTFQVGGFLKRGYPIIIIHF